MKKSIGKKVISLMTGLGILLVLSCFMTVGAMTNVAAYNAQLEETFASYREAIESQDADAIKAAQENYEYIVERSNVRVGGTKNFNFFLTIVSAILMVIAIVVVNKSIASPAKEANSQLSGIVEKIEKNHGDLTTRIETKSQDEIGQLVNGINIFIEQLQNLMKKLQRESSRMMVSVGEVSNQVDESNKSAMSVSAATQELAAGMEEIAATLD